MITITRIKAVATENKKTKKNHQIYKPTLINDKIRISSHFNFRLILNNTGFLIFHLMKIFQDWPDSPPQIRFGSNYERVVRRDRFYGY